MVIVVFSNVLSNWPSTPFSLYQEPASKVMLKVICLSVASRFSIVILLTLIFDVSPLKKMFFLAKINSGVISLILSWGLTLIQFKLVLAKIKGIIFVSLTL